MNNNEENNKGKRDHWQWPLLVAIAEHNLAISAIATLVRERSSEKIPYQPFISISKPKHAVSPCILSIYTQPPSILDCAPCGALLIESL